jgi:hypothetical protein
MSEGLDESVVTKGVGSAIYTALGALIGVVTGGSTGLRERRWGMGWQLPAPGLASGFPSCIGDISACWRQVRQPRIPMSGQGMWRFGRTLPTAAPSPASMPIG